MAEKLVIYSFGEKGVNVDKDPLVLENNELRQAQNAIRDPLGVEGGLKNRPGLEEFNADAAAGAVLGGVGVPFTNLRTGTVFLFLGRGPL